jgi:hypothetical protein
VPSPPRGYWAKKQTDKPVKQIRFVNTVDPGDERIVIHVGGKPDLPEPVKEILDEACGLRSKTVASAATLPIKRASAEGIHKAVVATAKALRRAKPDKEGAVSATEEGTCGIVVGSSSVERVISILDALVSSLEGRGLNLVPNGKNMSVASEVETVTLSIVERVDRTKHIPTPEEIAKEERRQRRTLSSGNWSFERAYPEWDICRTGRLSLALENHYLDGLRRSWNEGKHQRLEDSIEDMATGIMAYAVGLKVRTEARERDRRNWERQARVRARAEQRAKRDAERRKILDELAAISAEATKLRVWLGEANNWKQPLEPNEFGRFVEWATARLDRLEHAVDPEGIAEALRSRNLFPESDPLIDPPEDLVKEQRLIGLIKNRNPMGIWPAGAGGTPYRLARRFLGSQGGVEGGAGSEHGTRNVDQAISARSQGAAVAMTTAWERGVFGPALGVALHGDACPMVHGVDEPVMACLSTDHDAIFTRPFGDRRDSCQTAQGGVVASLQGIEGFCEQRGEDDPSHSLSLSHIQTRTYRW